MDEPVTTGYYRYTDIWFEWHQALPNPSDADPLKAVIAHDSLVHPDSPLHKDGVEGIEMYMGTLQNGESRLLFSSTQVEYVRYWLHAMKLTKEPIPIPYSDCLLTDSDLRNVSPVVFKTGGDLKKSIKDITKNNKRLKGAHPELNTRRDLFERVRTFWSEKVGVWCAIDFEAWDRDHTLITELGWSAVRWENGKEVTEKGHLVVDEHIGFTNTYVPQHRWNYNFGESETIKKAAFKIRVQQLITEYTRFGPLFLVFHDNSQDLKYLRSKAVEAPLSGLTHVLPDATPEEGIFVVDTADLFAALEGDAGNNRRGLERVCRHLQIEADYLHNAGNDAYYTLLAMQEMASGDPVDIQREKRWPNQTANEAGASRGVKVQFQPWEDDSDYSDTEGMVPVMSGYDPKTGELLPLDPQLG